MLAAVIYVVTTLANHNILSDILMILCQCVKKIEDLCNRLINWQGSFEGNSLKVNLEKKMCDHPKTFGKFCRLFWECGK